MACSESSSWVPSMPPSTPKSPPQYPNLYGKRQELAKVQMLEREIGFLEEELKFSEGLPPASWTCKQVTDLVVTNSDPLILVTRKKRRYCLFWKWLCGMSGFNISWICCCGCSLKCKMPHCCCWTCQSCCNCSIPKCCCCCCRVCQCLKKCQCRLICCISDCFSSSECSCNKCTFCCPRCPKAKCDCCCTKICCYPYILQ